MKKIVEGIELLRMIRDGEIKNGTTINLYLDQHQIGEYYLREKSLFNKDDNDLIDKEYFLDIFINDTHKFEILSEEDEEIDIDSIEEINYEVNFGYVNCGNMTKEVKEGLNRQFNNINNKINELIKAVKQLNKKLEEK